MSAVVQPSGTVTLVFTDVEGSTALLDLLGAEAYRDVLAEHRRLLREAFAANSGYEVDDAGDGLFYAFASASRAVSAVEQVMAALADGPVRIRVGVHTGEPVLDPPKYVGPDVHKAARIMSAAHGGQVLLSGATRELVADDVLDLGKHRLKDFAESVSLFQLGAGRFPPLRTVSNTNLPVPVSSFVGREREVDEVVSLVRSEGARLVTLAGPGGTGKTRLALEVAGELVSDFTSGVFWVGLAPIRDPALVVDTIAQTLGAKQELAAHIGENELMLLLDNLEQVVAAAPELEQLLQACPNLRLVVTSRELLRVDGEVVYPVPPLADEDAVDLFSARARIRPDENVAELCKALENLPLALELAAGRTSVLSPEQILERISQRLDLFKGGRDADPRQRTLRATIEWSYALLELDEQRLLAKLSVFAGGCTLEAAERVCGASLDQLQSLLEKNLLRRRQLAGESRFSMLETVREYALERLEGQRALENVCDAYSDYYLAVARARVEELDKGELTAVHALERDLDNFLAAFAWHEPEHVPVPVDDGACDHLLGRSIPSLALDSSHGPLDLAAFAAGQLVLYVYPGTTKPGRPPLPGLYQLPGGRGCTAENRAYREHATELANLGVRVAGISVQTLDQQLEFASRAHMPFPLLADPDRRLEATLALPTFEVAGTTLYNRVTLVIEQGTIIKVFYPVFPPDRNAEEVTAWLTSNSHR